MSTAAEPETFTIEGSDLETARFIARDRAVGLITLMGDYLEWDMLDEVRALAAVMDATDSDNYSVFRDAAEFDADQAGYLAYLANLHFDRLEDLSRGGDLADEAFERFVSAGESLVVALGRPVEDLKDRFSPRPKFDQ